MGTKRLRDTSGTLSRAQRNPTRIVAFLPPLNKSVPRLNTEESSYSPCATFRSDFVAATTTYGVLHTPEVDEFDLSSLSKLANGVGISLATVLVLGPKTSDTKGMSNVLLVSISRCWSPTRQLETLVNRDYTRTTVVVQDTNQILTDTQRHKHKNTD